MSANFYELLKYAATGQASPGMTYYDRMRASTLMGGGAVQTLTGIPPLTFNANGTPLISWSMKGNTQQAGTPTPDNPIMPTFCGVRTSNLAEWEKGGISTATGADEAYRTAAQGGTCEQMRSLYTPCSGNATYVLHSNHYPVQSFISYYDANKNYISRSSGTPQGENRIFTTPETARYMRAQLAHITAGQAYPAIEENQQYAITLESTALPYEPFGYKTPVTCAGQTVPVYLGQVSTVRRIKKLVLTGDEFWRDYSGNIWSNAVDSDSMQGTTCICTHLDSQRNSGIYISNGSTRLKVYASSVSSVATTAEEWVQYLQQQYANGTPVTVWYILAEPATGIANEPLAKIGDYADELHSEDVGVTIPTVKGQNTLTVDTVLQPSEMTITYRN